METHSQKQIPPETEQSLLIQWLGSEALTDIVCKDAKYTGKKNSLQLF